MESGGVIFWSGQEGGKLTKLTSKKQNKLKKTTKQQSKKQNKQKGFKPLGNLTFFASMLKIQLLIKFLP